MAKILIIGGYTNSHSKMSSLKKHLEKLGHIVRTYTLDRFDGAILGSEKYATDTIVITHSSGLLPMAAHVGSFARVVANSPPNGISMRKILYRLVRREIVGAKQPKNRDRVLNWRQLWISKGVGDYNLEELVDKHDNLVVTVASDDEVYRPEEYSVDLTTIQGISHDGIFTEPEVFIRCIKDLGII
ncbi:MAG: hypothetical protein AAF413_01075 [Patescibacteria group bacterium]